MSQRFNGGLFTWSASMPDYQLGIDFREWGSGTWLQNTRLM